MKNASLLLALVVTAMAAGNSDNPEEQSQDHDKSLPQYFRGLATGDGTATATATHSFVLDSGDLDIRFNKFKFVNEEMPDFMPLHASDYPIRSPLAEKLKYESNAISVLCDDDPALDPDDQAKIYAYINAIGGFPSMPNANSKDPFWDEFREVTMTQIGRRQNMNPSTLLRPPNLWASNDIHAVADAVHDEYPGYHQVSLIQWIWKRGTKIDHDILPFRSQFDFVGNQVALADLNTWAIGAVAPLNFYMKWFVGRPRPEEVAYKIATGELTESDGVPEDIVQDIRSMNLNTPEEYTAYPEGAPRHPSWPAMHSAASSASFWLAVVLDLTPEEYCEALRLDYSVAFARTCAGVHYPSDNIAGLNLGQHLIAEKLPGHLAETYGSDPAKVKAKIDSLRFDWANFNSWTCTTALY